MLFVIGRLILAKILTDSRVKKAVIDELKELAADTQSTWDDDAVKRVDEAWDVVVPAIVGKAG